MAEVIGLVASIASLIAFTSATSKACHKLAESIARFKNAQTEIQMINVELLDLAQILELIESVLQPLQKDEAGVQGHLEPVERSLTRIKTGVQEIADMLVAVQSTARGSSTKTRAKWMFKKSDIASMTAIIDRQKHGLLLQFNLLNTKFAHRTHADLKDFRQDLKQAVPRTEDLAASITTSISESTSRFENVVQASATSLESLMKDEIHRTVLSIPRESNISQASLQTLSVLVSNIVASRFESFESETSLYPGSRSYTHVESVQRVQNEPQTEDLGTMNRVSQTMTDDSSNEDSGHFNREEVSSRLISRTSVQTMTSVFGRVIIRRSTVKIVYMDSDPDSFSEKAKMEIDLFPASWLRFWTGCGILLARMGFGKPAFNINLILARVVDFDSNLDTQKALRAVKTGDLRTLKRSLHRKAVYPTDRNLDGWSLLIIATASQQFEICELLLQQGAAVGINRPERMDTYPMEIAIFMSRERNDHDLVRLFLKYDADTTIDVARENITLGSLTWEPLRLPSARTHETRSLFRLLVDNDPAFDINQRQGTLRNTSILEARSQPLQIYEELIRLGADAKVLDGLGRTVLHKFFDGMFPEFSEIVPVDTFLEGGEILALLIQAGADPLAADYFGVLPQDFRSRLSSFPLRRLEEQIFLAFWHQALRICDLSESKHCHCAAHKQEKMHGQDSKIRFPWRRRGPLRSLPYATFEEEMSAALTSWDKSVAQRSNPGSADLVFFGGPENWNERCDRFDKWIQEVLIELQARQKKVFTERHGDTSLSVEGSTKRTEKENFKSDEMQFSDPNMKELIPLTHDSDSEEDWETDSSSSGNSEEKWESAPET